MLPSECIIIAIDGPAGSGKSTLAKGLAQALGINYLNSGATYRALAVKALDEGIDPSDDEAASTLASSTRIDVIYPPDSEEDARVLVDGVDITDRLFTDEVSLAASKISKHRAVRERIVGLQRKIVERLCREMSESPKEGTRFRGVIVEGRDIGTVVFPDAKVKFYLDASLEERARRRMAESDSPDESLRETMSEVLERDVSDIQRSVSPLRPAPDAMIIDNTGWEKEDTLKHALELVRGKIAEPVK